MAYYAFFTQMISKRRIIFILLFLFFASAVYIYISASQNFDFTKDYIVVLNRYELREKAILGITSNESDEKIKQLLIQNSTEIDSDIYSMERWSRDRGLKGDSAGQMIIALEAAKEAYDDVNSFGGKNAAARKGVLDATVLLMDGAKYRLFILPWKKHELKNILDRVYSADVLAAYRDNLKNVVPGQILAAAFLRAALE